MQKPQSKPDKDREEALKKKIIFTKCVTKAMLHRWIRLFLDLDFPDCIVDPESTSSPMDMIWEVYERAMKNDDPAFNRVLYYAARDSFKTLGAAVLELLMILHLGRDVCHMAAIKAQSGKAQSYLKKFLSRPVLRDYLDGDAKEMTVVTRYNNPRTGKNLNKEEYKALPKGENNDYIEVKNYVKVVVCTMQGANSDHVPFFVVDEVDVVRNPAAYEEAKLIPAPINGLLPITVLASTRKFSFGMVQKEIDNQTDSDGEQRLQIRHWNIIDVTEACPPTRHLPMLPKIPIYVDQNKLRAVSEEKYNALSDDDKENFKPEEGYAGCLQNCKLFASCHGNLATRQASKSKLLRPISHTTNQFTGIGLSVPMALAQLLCKKPSTEGLIYPNFDRDVHGMDPSEMAEEITGEKYPDNFTKEQLIALMREKGLKPFSGMDFGFTHNFAVVTGFQDGQRIFIVDVIAQAELLPDQQVLACSIIKPLNPSIFADPENRQMVMVFRKSGFKMRNWVKGPGSVLDGINIVRMHLTPPMADPRLFFLTGDPQVELLIRRMSQYHWKLDAAGKPSDVPDETDDDECDALRYLVMNVLSGKGTVIASSIQKKNEKSQADSSPDGVYTKENWFAKVLQEHGATSAPDGSLAITTGGIKISW
jgi:hypothetical protein